MRTANQIRTEARAILSEFAATYPILGHMPIRVSTRMTRSAGSARWMRGVPFEIVLSLPFYADGRSLRNTVTHEAAHIVAGPAAGHGPEWQRAHRSMGGTGKRCHTMSLSEGFTHTPRKRAARVEVPCPKCSQPMLLGPTRAKRAARGVRYSHGKCPPPITMAEG